MRIYYKLWLTREDEHGESMAIGMTADNGLSLYGEINDFDSDSIEPAADECIADQLLGRDGMKKLIIERPKTKGLIAPMQRVAGWVRGYLLQFDSVELIGFSNYFEMKKMLWITSTDLELFSKQLSIVNYSSDFMEQYKGILDTVLVNFPEYNALRWAVMYKHAAREYEEKIRNRTA